MTLQMAWSSPRYALQMSCGFVKIVMLMLKLSCAESKTDCHHLARYVKFRYSCRSGASSQTQMLMRMTQQSAQTAPAPMRTRRSSMMPWSWHAVEALAASAAAGAWIKP